MKDEIPFSIIPSTVSNSMSTSMSQIMQPRIFLWSSPRTISTAFFRAMESRENIKVFLEPYSSAYFFGKERLSNYFDNIDMYPQNDEFSMQEAYDSMVNIKYESPVFAKDHAFYILCRESPMRYIPEGFENAFLFRHPRKSFISGYRAAIKNNPSEKNLREVYEAGFYSMKPVLDLYQKVRCRNPEKQLFVIDADDFIREPEKLLRAFCSHFSLEYEDSMLNWDKNRKQTTTKDSVWKIPFEDAIASNTIDGKINDANADKMSKVEIPEYIEKLIEEDLVYYEKLLEIKYKL